MRSSCPAPDPLPISYSSDPLAQEATPHRAEVARRILQGAKPGRTRRRGQECSGSRLPFGEDWNPCGPVGPTTAIKFKTNDGGNILPLEKVGRMVREGDRLSVNQE
jgi:hypothetical protein